MNPLAALLFQIVLNPPAAPGVIQVDVDLVNVLCTVRDSHGGYVKGLSKEDFEIREDGKPRRLTHFAREVDTPMQVALLLDVSGSVQGVIGVEKSAAQRFFDEVLRPGDKALLAGFAQRIAVWQDLTGDKDELQDSLAHAGPHALPQGNPEFAARGGTLLYDAIFLTASQKLQRIGGRKIILVISDGLDNGSVANTGKAVHAAQEADAVIYGIHYEDEELTGGRAPGLDALERLSTPTGGRAFHVSKKLTLDKVFADIAEEMRNQYGLGYPPPKEKDGSFHKLEVKLKRPGLKVQARSGYYR